MAEMPELAHVNHPSSFFESISHASSAPQYNQFSEAFVSSIITTAARQATADRDDSGFKPPAMVATFGVGSFGSVRPPLGGVGRVQSPSARPGQNTNDFRAEERYLVPPSSASFSGSGTLIQHHYADENAPLNTPTSRTPVEEVTPKHSKGQSPRVPLSSRSGNLIVSGVSGSLVKKEMRRKDEEIAALKAQLERVMSGIDVAGNPPGTQVLSANGMSTPLQRVELDFDEEDLDNECPMCMSPLKRKRGSGADDDPKRYTVITHCGHRFHLDCLQSTRNFDMTGCPMCRAELPSGITPAKKIVDLNPNRVAAHQPPRYNAPRLVAPVIEEVRRVCERVRGAKRGAERHFCGIHYEVQGQYASIRDVAATSIRSRF